MAKTTAWFESTQDPSAALSTFASLAEARGWKVRKRTTDSITARRPFDGRTWGNRITVTTAPRQHLGSYVDVCVSSRQLIDWGTGKAIAAEVEHRLA